MVADGLCQLAEALRTLHRATALDGDAAGECVPTRADALAVAGLLSSLAEPGSADVAALVATLCAECEPDVNESGGARPTRRLAVVDAVARVTSAESGGGQLRFRSRSETLSPLEYELLRILYSRAHAGGAAAFFSNHALTAHALPFDVASPGPEHVKNLVYRFKKKLRAVAGVDVVIGVQGLGYRLDLAPLGGELAWDCESDVTSDETVGRP